MGFINQLIKPVFQKTRLLNKEKISSGFYHIKIYSEDLKELDYTIGQHLKIYVGHDEPGIIKGKARSYSVWKFDKNEGTFDIAINTLSNGVGAEWVKNLEENDSVYFFGPKGSITLDTSYDNYYFFGDTTTLAHFYGIKRNLTDDKKVFSMIYADSEDLFFSDFNKNNSFDCKVIKNNDSKKVLEYIKALPFFKDERSILYIGGEETVCKDIYSYFQKEHDWNKNDIKMKAFWDSEE